MGSYFGLHVEQGSPWHYGYEWCKQVDPVYLPLWIDYVYGQGGCYKAFCGVCVSFTQVNMHREWRQNLA